MKKFLFTLTLGTALLPAAVAQKTALPPKADVQAIKGQCGCQAVTFKYAETFSPNPEYKFKDRKELGGLEWVFVDEETPTKLVLMHLLVINDSTVIKHWREDWSYENTALLAYQQGKTWKATLKTKPEVKGQWTQKVFEVDDSPRYEGTATWVHADGRHVWENTTDAPLPRREYTTRSDYNVLRRTNRIVVSETGYLHDQDNAKVLRNDEGDQVIAYEKGINDYRRVPAAACQTAQTWWTKNRAFWVNVRTVWNELIAARKVVSLHAKVDDKAIFQALDSLASAYAKAPKPSAQNKADLRAVLLKYFADSDRVGKAD